MRTFVEFVVVIVALILSIMFYIKALDYLSTFSSVIIGSLGIMIVLLVIFALNIIYHAATYYLLNRYWKTNK